MERTYFLKTDRIGFTRWTDVDLPLAQSLWGDPAVTKYICASGNFSQSDMENRLQKELEQEQQYGIQYWPIFELASGEFIGCCGLRPHKEKQPEIEKLIANGTEQFLYEELTNEQAEKLKKSENVLFRQV